MRLVRGPLSETEKHINKTWMVTVDAASDLTALEVQFDLLKIIKHLNMDRRYS